MIVHSLNALGFLKNVELNKIVFPNIVFGCFAFFRKSPRKRAMMTWDSACSIRLARVLSFIYVSLFSTGTVAICFNRIFFFFFCIFSDG